MAYVPSWASNDAPGSTFIGDNVKVISDSSSSSNFLALMISDSVTYSSMGKGSFPAN